MFVVFLALIIGPIIVAPQIDVSKFTKGSGDLVQSLVQPSNWNNNDTYSSITGTATNAHNAATAGAAGVTKRAFAGAY